MSKPVLVIGAGAWGTALATVLAGNGYPVWLWGRDPEHIAALNAHRCNRYYLPEADFPESLQPVDDLNLCLDECDELVLAVPFTGIRVLLESVNEYTDKQLKICLTSKGLEPGTQYLGHAIVTDCLGDKAKIAILSGPSFATEVAARMPTAVTIASVDRGLAMSFAEKFHNEMFRVYTHDDIIGVQMGGATKNIIAIATGISDGLGFGCNARAALLTRGLAEITRFGVDLGGEQETFMGLTGLGDLILTCTDNQSRNRQFGFELAKGIDALQACENVARTVEGMNTARQVFQLALKNNIDMPITEQVCKVIDGSVEPSDAVNALLARQRKSELS